MDLMTILDFKLSDKVFQDFQSPKEFHFIVAFNVTLKKFSYKRITWQKTTIIAQLSNERKT